MPADEELTAWERAWLNWAHPIVRTAIDSPQHHEELRRLTDVKAFAHDEASDPASDPTLYWPGFVGSEWGPEQGILFVGSIHGDFLAGTVPRSPAERHRIVKAMAEANRRWRDSDRTEATDRGYLETTRASYSALIPGWRRDDQFALVRQHLGEPLERTAWTNLAHGRALPQNPSEYKLQHKCSARNGRHPIGGLIDALRPAAIVSCVSPLEGSHRSKYGLRTADGWEPELFAFDGRTGKRHGQRPEVWSAQVAGEIRARRQ